MPPQGGKYTSARIGNLSLGGGFEVVRRLFDKSPAELGLNGRAPLGRRDHVAVSLRERKQPGAGYGVDRGVGLLCEGFGSGVKLGRLVGILYPHERDFRTAIATEGVRYPCLPLAFNRVRASRSRAETRGFCSHYSARAGLSPLQKRPGYVVFSFSLVSTLVEFATLVLWRE